MPIGSLHQENFSVLIEFVNKSITLSKVSTFTNNTFFTSTMSLTKWYWTLISFVLEWQVGFLAKKIALLLSRSILTTWCTNQIPKHNLYKNTTSFLSWVDVMYLDYIVKSATTDCVLLIHVISPPNRLNTYPLIDLLQSRYPSHYASTKPCMSNNLSNHDLPW